MDNQINTCSEQVFDVLKENIIAGKYRPNDRLLYKEISSELGVSISPVREAFLNLEKIGLVTITPRKGVYVRHISDDDNIEYSRIRFALEALAVEQICKNGITESDLSVLRKINNAFRDSLDQEEGACLKSIDYDIDFHSQLIIDSKMKRLQELAGKMPLSNLRALTDKQECFLDRGEQIYETHENIIKALIAGDVELAKSYLYQNIIVPLQELAEAQELTEDVQQS